MSLNDFEAYTELLFEHGEWVNWVEKLYSETVSYPRKDAPGEPKWVCVNPLHEFSNRAQANISAHRNFVLEIDDMTYEEQLAYIEGYRVPVSSAVFSGNKSIHFVIALDEDLGEIHYRHYCRLLAKALPKVDKSCLEPARLTRCPCEGQPLLFIRGVTNRLEFDSWLRSQGLEPDPSKDKPEAISYTPTVGGRLTLKTMKFIQGALPSEEMHEASLHATKNMLDVGFSEEEALNVLMDVRRKTVAGESKAVTQAKARRVLEWVKTNWRD